jgi:hypothetical protein
MENPTEFKTKSANKATKERVDRLRPFLPFHYKQQLLKLYPEYKTAKGLQHITNVVACRTVDVILTERLVKMVNEHYEKLNTLDL